MSVNSEVLGRIHRAVGALKAAEPREWYAGFDWAARMEIGESSNLDGLGSIAKVAESEYKDPGYDTLQIWMVFLYVNPRGEHMHIKWTGSHSSYAGCEYEDPPVIVTPATKSVTVWE